ncbi:MAG TPA: GDP-mannose 4,6-dehydratase [Chloroflexota bacterium]|nr:GDP-mannose 4,6-dehydratase [Chloroflexota bacterium]
MRQTVLITGSSGFVGGFLANLYADAGWDVHGTVRNDTASGVLQRITLHHLDLEDTGAVRELIGVCRPMVVHHLAAQSSVRVSAAQPLATLISNLVMQRHILDAVAASAYGTRVVVVGSADEYGCVKRAENPVSEDQPLLPVSAYGLSKVGQDLMGYEFFAAHALPVVRVRPFLQIGPRRPDRFAAGSFARQVAEIEAGRREPRIDVGNIDQVRDMCDVRDVARAMRLAAESGQAGAVYNIASGEGHTHRELIRLMLEMAGVQAEIHEDRSRRRPVEPEVIIGDSSRLRADTGWSPAIDFRTSVRDTLEYWRERVSRCDER